MNGLAGKPEAVDAHKGQGRVILFAKNPMWRNEIQGSCFPPFHPILNFDRLGAGVAAPEAGRP